MAIFLTGSYSFGEYKHYCNIKNRIYFQFQIALWLYNLTNIVLFTVISEAIYDYSDGYLQKIWMKGYDEIYRLQLEVCYFYNVSQIKLSTWIFRSILLRKSNLVELHTYIVVIS